MYATRAGLVHCRGSLILRAKSDTSHKTFVGWASGSLSPFCRIDGNFRKLIIDSGGQLHLPGRHDSLTGAGELAASAVFDRAKRERRFRRSEKGKAAAGSEITVTRSSILVRVRPLAAAIAVREPGRRPTLCLKVSGIEPRLCARIGGRLRFARDHGGARASALGRATHLPRPLK